MLDIPTKKRKTKMIFRHFKTLKEARAHIAKVDPTGHKNLVYRKKKGKHKKPYMVGTPLSFLHFA